ncbi:TonB-dependent receptor [Chitinophaga sp. G-6-1-13]|uniref:TonB-dependent receptor n=1 Tax=Chitinophaga fulva TaxID=2728842 RepID=A0A848GLN9_9BACT|nr:TonB-dependent receptor [Chitinophaga fulva]NML38299.1 TonB-dependent receptor [Chitinophaga fulva]
MKKFIIVLGILMSVIMSSFAQKSSTGTISFKITDASGKPLPFASVLLRKTQDSVQVKGEMSSESGEGRFEKIPFGQYYLQVSQMGFTTHYAANFALDASHTSVSLPAIALQPLSKSLQTVNVTATKPFIEKSAGKTVLNVENSVTAVGNTALDILKRAPGVQIDNNENVKMKGQTVTVMIDGKLTYLSGEDLTNLLKNTPGESIAQIEILTSPSAKYDASGNGGIINIKTKKGKLTGINGTVNATLSQSRYGTYSANGTFNWRTPKFNLFGDLGRTDRPFQITRKYSRAFNDKGVTTEQTQDIFQRNRFQRNAAKIGLDYFLNDKHTIGVLVNGFKNRFNNQIYSNTNFMNTPGAPADSIVNSYTTNNNHFNNIAINLNYKAVLDTAGREYSVDADYARFNADRSLVLNDSMLDVKSKLVRNPNGIRNQGGTQITIKSLKGDFAWPLGKNGKVEAGLKASLVTTTNRLAYDSLKNGDYIFAPSQSNEFKYQEDVYAAYASYKKQLTPKTGIQAGLRVENTKSDGYSVTLKSQVVRNYTDFFPNLTIDQKLNDNNKISLAYSRRIERPEYSQLNPFMFYLDRYTFFRGNPYLQPQYTNNVELAYTFKDKYIATLGYNRTTDVINEFLYQDDSAKTSTSTLMNYKKSHVYSLAVTLPFQVTKWWMSDNNLNAAYNDYYFNNNKNQPEMTSSFTYSFNSTNTITLPKDFKLEVAGYYNSPFVYAIFKGYAEYNLNLGIQKTFWDKKATIKLNYNNILRNESYRGIAQYSNLALHIFNTWQFRTASIYFSYRFGSSSIKAARERKTGTSDEQKRAG